MQIIGNMSGIKYLKCSLFLDLTTKFILLTSHLTVRTETSSNVWNMSQKSDRVLEQLSMFVLNESGNQLKPRNIWLEWGPSFWGVRAGNEAFDGCKVRHCYILQREAKEDNIDLRMFSEGVSFHDLPNLRGLNREDHEIWMLHSLESPMSAVNFQSLDNIFNWTATYRTDSTIVIPYDKWIKLDKRSADYINIAKEKTKKVAIFVSNCHTTNNRLEYVLELSKYIEVDIYGKCGSLECPKSGECFEMLQKEYKFYLAFENSNCRDYITEKFYTNALRNDVLPIVMGAHPDDYKRSAPEHSYIHVEDFDSPKDLAEYLHKLDKNDTLYNSYFRWKGTGTFIDTKFWCRLCAMLNDPNKPNLVVNELDRWWRSERVCIRWDQKWTK